MKFHFERFFLIIGGMLLGQYYVQHIFNHLLFVLIELVTAFVFAWRVE